MLLRFGMYLAAASTTSVSGNFTVASERVVFSSAMEAAWHALTPRTAEEQRVIDRLGLAPGRFRTAYAATEYFELLEATANSRFSSLPEFERYSALGRLMTENFEKTVVGRALFVLLRLMGPERTLKRMTQNLRASNNFSTGRAVELEPGTFELTTSAVESPGLIHGIVETLMAVAGARGLSVKLCSYDGDAAVFLVRWEP